MAHSTRKDPPETPVGPGIADLVAQGERLRAQLRDTATGHPHVADDLAGLADELDDILFRLAGLATRRPLP
ncbi:hypothetical protein N866_15890 [Actinotalea ferrariae CF5-4]|uniref:Uncharacterized protein n=1 Tax=Actinotalea ferrariae CF5-4 TaxID=948458 RepID=A0A021VSE2_9CELL|nr:hypothetical protein [Actinotalea ferrariae]EYR64081.1 hypothetical protein N866_15890 [Actinotalea ferrariae CF5-4]